MYQPKNHLVLHSELQLQYMWVIKNTYISMSLRFLVYWFRYHSNRLGLHPHHYRPDCDTQVAWYDWGCSHNLCGEQHPIWIHIHESWFLQPELLTPLWYPSELPEFDVLPRNEVEISNCQQGTTESTKGRGGDQRNLRRLESVQWSGQPGLTDDH